MARTRVICDLDHDLNLIGLSVTHYTPEGERDHCWVQPVGPFDSQWRSLEVEARMLAAEYGQLRLRF